MRTRPAAVAALAALLLLVGCSTGGDDVTNATLAPSSSTGDQGSTAESPPPGSESSDVGAQETVEALALDDDDLLEGETAELRELGDEVENQVTMDYCGFVFTSEDERVARHQVNVYADGTYANSNEAVLYAPGMAAVAMDEVRQAIYECPSDVAVPSVVQGVPDMIYEATPLPADRVSGLAADHIAVMVNARTTEGMAQTTTLIYQRRGDALVGTYGELERALELAEAVAVRLADAPAADVGA